MQSLRFSRRVDRGNFCLHVPANKSDFHRQSAAISAPLALDSKNGEILLYKSATRIGQGCRTTSVSCAESAFKRMSRCRVNTSPKSMHLHFRKREAISLALSLARARSAAKAISFG